MLTKNFKAAFIAVFLCLIVSLGGCATMTTLADYLNENPVFANVATRQAVGRYIASGETLEEERARAEAVHDRISIVLEHVKGNPSTTVDSLMLVIGSVIPWETLERSDRVLIADIVTLVEGELRKFEPEEKPMSEKSALAIRALFNVAISAAEVYLRR